MSSLVNPDVAYSPDGGSPADYVRHSREMVRPMLRVWSDRMVVACAVASVMFIAVALASAASGYIGGPMVAIFGFLSGGGLALAALAWRLFSVAALQMLQLLEMAATDIMSDPA